MANTNTGINLSPSRNVLTGNNTLSERLAEINSRKTTSSAPAQTTTSSPAKTSAVVQSKDEDERNLWDKIKDFVGFTGEKAVAGAAEGTEGVVNSFGYLQQLIQKSAQQQAAGAAATAAAFSKSPEVDAMAQRRQEDAANSLITPMETYANFGDKYAEKVEEKYADKPLSKATRVIGDITQGLGGMVPAVAANIIAPGSGLAVMTTGAIGNATQEAKKSGADDATAIAYGLAVGTIEAATEKLLGGMGGLFGKGALDDVAKGLIQSRVGNSAARRGLTALVSAFGEGVEEFIAEYGSALANRLTIKTDERSGKELLSDAAYNALIGGMVGSIANIGEIINSGRNMTPQEAAQEAAEQTAQMVENSPSVGVSTQTATDMGENGNVKQGQSGYDGVGVGEVGAVPKQSTAGVVESLSQTSENFDVDSAQPQGVADGIYGKSVGAAAPAVGEMVPTQNKAITQNINLGEQSIAENQPAPHERITEAMSLARAGAMLYTDSEGNIINFDETLDALMNKEGNWKGVESDAAQLLLKEAEIREDAQAVKRIAERMAQEGTDLGQALQSRQKWISTAPSSRLAAMYQAVNKFAADHKAKRGRNIEIPDFLAEAYLKAGDEQTRDIVISDIQQYVAQQSRASLGEAWTALRYTNMLGNFKTQARNILGNTTMYYTSRAKDAVAALAEALGSLVSGGNMGRTKSVVVGRDWMKAAKADFSNAKNAILSIGKYSSENFKGDFVEGIENYRKLLPPGLEQYRRATNWAMETGDKIFSKATYSRALAGYLKANGATPEQLSAGAIDAALMERAREYAIKQAQEATFRDSNAFSDAVVNMRFKAPKNAAEKAFNALGQGLAPFRRTPANVLARAVEYSPLGLLTSTAKAVQAAKGNATASDVIDALSKNLTGAGLMYLGYVLADNGLLRATGSDDEEDLDALMNRQDWSIVIPGVGSYTFDWAAPASLTMFTGAVLSELLSDEGLTLADVEGAITSLAEPFVQMSMLSGINDTLDSIKYSDNNLLQMAGTLAASYITQGLTNTLLGQVERIGEENRMSTYTEEDSPLPEWIQRTIGKASAKIPIPGVDFQQTEYLNEFGETESTPLGMRVFENLISPGYWEPTKEGETAYDFAERVREQLGVDAFPDAYPPDEVSYQGENYGLDQSERSEYQRTRGQAAKAFVEVMDSNSGFAKLDDDAKRDVITTAMQYAQESAKNEALESKGVSVDRSSKGEIIDRMTPDQYINWLVSDIGTPVADGYANYPTWQNFEKALALPDNLALDMIIATNESSGKKIADAVSKGVSLDDAVAYYRAINERNAEGKSPTKDQRNQRKAGLGLTQAELSILDTIFDK